jgi:hypothetical protein
VVVTAEAVAAAVGDVVVVDTCHRQAVFMQTTSKAMKGRCV